MVSLRKLAKKVSNKGTNNNCPDTNCPSSPQQEYHESLLSDRDECCYYYYSDETEESKTTKTPTGSLAVYVGEERRRFVVPTSYLSHPLFKMLLEKAYNEFGFQQRNGLVVPCSVYAFQEIVSAVECCNRKFDFGKLVEEFL